MDSDNGFGERVKSLRLESGLSQAKLAKAAGTRVMTISSWERGNARRPSIDLVQKVAKILRCDAGWLLTGSQPADSGVETPPDPPGLTAFFESTVGQTVPERGKDVLRALLGAEDPRSYSKNDWKGIWVSISHRYED